MNENRMGNSADESPVDPTEATVIEGEYEVIAVTCGEETLAENNYKQKKTAEKKSVFDKRNNVDRRKSHTSCLVETRTGDRRRHRQIDIQI